MGVIGEKMIKLNISMMQYLVVNPEGTRHLLFSSTSKLMKAIIASGHSDTDFQVTLIEPGDQYDYRNQLIRYTHQYYNHPILSDYYPVERAFHILIESDYLSYLPS